MKRDVGGANCTAAITNAAVGERAVGRQAYAVVKGSDEMITID